VSQGFPALQPIVIPPVPNGTATAVAPNFRPSYAEQFNLGVEHEIVPLEMVLKFVGVGNLGRHLQDVWNPTSRFPDRPRPCHGVRCSRSTPYRAI